MSCKPSKSDLFNLTAKRESLDSDTPPPLDRLNPMTRRLSVHFRHRLSRLAMAFSLSFIMVASGCTRSVPTYLHESGDLSHYLDQATAIEYPDVETASLDEVDQAHAPMTVIDPDFQNYEEICLEDAVSYALQNGKVFRGYGTPSLQGTRVSPGQDNLANGPNAAGTVYNVAIRESEPGFIGTPGQISNPGSILTNTGLDVNQGVEAALADFDAQLTGGISWNQTDEPRNTRPNNVLNPLVFKQDFVQWQAEIAKKSANGTQIFFRNVNNYTANSNPLAVPSPFDPSGYDPSTGLQVLRSWYRAAFEAEIRQPLLRGRGTFINRMPVVISRIGTDQTIANLEAQLQNFVTNVEIRYWDLYCAYRNLDAAKTGRDAALQTWRIVKDQFDEGADVNIQQVAQAGEQYFFFDTQVIDAYNSLLNAEGALRFLMGWSSTDGRVLRPSDEPVMAPVEFDWCESLCEALTYRPELRQERWEIKKKELALAYSKNGLLPELNATVLYRFLGLGNKYGTSGDSDFFPSGEGSPTPDFESGALNELYGGDFQELSLGVDFRLPVGFRRELANVRNAQLKLAQELARLEDMELDITKEMSESFRALAANQLIMQSSFNRWKETTIEERHFEELKDAGVETLDVALDAQRRRSQAEIAFYTALCEYNKVIALIHRRKGSILPYCNVCFSEGPWPGKAYQDAEGHARRRSASRQINYGWSRPQVISRGEDWPTAHNNGATGYSQVLNYDQQGAEPTTLPLEIPMEGEIYNGPYYESSANEAPANQVSPVASIAKEEIRNDSQVRQTSHSEPIQSSRQNRSSGRKQPATESKRQTKSNPDRSSATVIKSSLRQPARDNSARPTKRLKAQTHELSSANRAKNAAEANQDSKAVVRSGNLDWEGLGLSRPKQSNKGTVAKIKMND